MVEKYRLYTGLFFGALWVMLTLGFVSEELLPPLQVARNYLALLCDLVFLCLGVYALHFKRDIIVVVVFFAIGLVSSLLNHLGPIFIINGARDFFGLLFAVPICRFLLKSKHRDRFIESFDKQLWIFLFIQAFCLVWQFIRYGANDHGGGSMGNGFSGIVSTLIYIISFYLLSKRWKFGNYWHNLLDNKVYIILLFPTFLNETKISFVFLLAYFLLLLPIEWKTVFKVLISLPLLIVGMIGAAYAYLGITGQTVESVFSQAAMDDYMVGEDPEELVKLGLMIQDGTYDREDIGQVDIPRFTKIIFIPEALEDAAGGVLFGAGLGQFKGGSVLELTPYADTWLWLLSGSVPYVFFIMIQLGVLGLIWFLYSLISVLAPKSPVLLGKNIKLYVWIILALLMFYNDSLRFFPFCVILFYIVLRGYVNVPKEEIVESVKPLSIDER